MPECDPATERLHPRGFTLIEVLIAMLIGTVGLLSLTALQTHALWNNCFANRLTQATHLARSKMEQLNVSLAHLENYSGKDVEEVMEGCLKAIGQDGVSGGPFSLFWKVEPNTAFSHRVSVRVTWNGGRAGWGKLRKVEVSSITWGGSHAGIQSTGK